MQLTLSKSVTQILMLSKVVLGSWISLDCAGLLKLTFAENLRNILTYDANT